MNRVEFEAGTKKKYRNKEEKRVQIASYGDDVYTITSSGIVEISLMDLSILFLTL